MMTLEQFGDGMEMLCVTYQVEPSKALLDSYFAALALDFTDDEWPGVVREVLRTWDRPRVLPPPQWILKLAQASGQEDGLAAVRAWESLLGKPAYTPETGEHWTYRYVAETWGKEVADAFLAAGGATIFNNMRRQDEQFVMRRFTEAHVQIKRQQRLRLALPPPTPKALKE